MEGDTPDWIRWINFDAGSDAQPWGYEENQGDLGAEFNRIFPDLGLGPLSVDQTRPLYDTIGPTHPFTRWPSPSTFNFEDVTSQQHVLQSSLSESDIFAEPVSQTYVDHSSLINGGVLEDTVGREQPMDESCLTRHESEGKNRDQACLDPNHKCSCMNCLLLGTQRGIVSPQSGPIREIWAGYDSEACRFPGCQEQIGYTYPAYMKHKVAEHERTHFGIAEDYHCLEEGCQLQTKKFADLKRHYTVRHCTNATRFPCPAFGCKYGGDNGFTRKDKLNSHHRNVHQGKAVPGKAFQPIKPKANGTKVIKGKPQGVQTIKPKPGAGA